jgi:hypothetical protein
MVMCRPVRWLVLGIAMTFGGAAAWAQQAGSIRGMVYDKDFDAPLALAQILIVETGQKVVATEEGRYIFSEVAPGTYTLVFSKEGYAREVKADVVVAEGRLTDVDAWLSGEFTEMEEFVVRDLQIGGERKPVCCACAWRAPPCSTRSVPTSSAGRGPATPPPPSTSSRAPPWRMASSR